MKKGSVIFVITLSVCISAFAYIRFREGDRGRLSDEAAWNKWLRAKPGNSVLRSGDLIFRHGRGAISDALKVFSRREAKYSHAGIICIENNKAYVYHAMGGEENSSGKLRKDPIEFFCSPKQAHLFGIYRLDLNAIKLHKLDSLVKKYYRKGLEFDTKFNMNTDERMYCSEFVYKVIAKITSIENYLPLSTCSGMNYVACDDLYLNAHSRLVYSYHY